MSIKYSGSYDIAATEQLSQEAPQKIIPCLVVLLDGSKEKFNIDRKTKGQELFDQVYDCLDLLERDFFGLQFYDIDRSLTETKWLDATKVVRKQFRNDPPYTLFFRVKFYIPDPEYLQEEYTRYLFFLQIKKNLYDGRLVCPQESVLTLASYAAQSELGDFSSEDNKPGYLRDLKIIPSPSLEMEREVSRLHSGISGLTPAESEFEFLRIVMKQDLYGLVLVDALEATGESVQLGASHAGVSMYKETKRDQVYLWNNIVKISFKKKQFSVHLKHNASDPNDQSPLLFSLATCRQARHLWKDCIQQHTFFRMPAHHMTSARLPGRTWRAVVEMKKRAQRGLTRTPSHQFARRTVGGTSHHVISTERNVIDGERNVGTNLGTNIHPARRCESMVTTRSQTPPKGSEKDRWSTTATVPAEPPPKDPEQGTWSPTPSVPAVPLLKTRPDRPLNGTSGKSLPRRTKAFHMARRGPVRGKTAQEEGGSIGCFDVFSETQSPGLPPSNAAASTDLTEPQVNGGQLSPVPTAAGASPPSPCVDSPLLTIRIRPDSRGRFGFNVKGGVDQGLSVMVSRVGEGTPADVASPRLQEGDEVLYINGRDVSSHTHEQVVQFIRAAAEVHSGELVLVIRPKVCLTEIPLYEPTTEDPTLEQNGAGASSQDEAARIIEVILPTPPTSPHQGATGHPLVDSVLALEESMKSGLSMTQFEQLYRRKPGLTMHTARLPANQAKNRYRDISPYDDTRVVLQNSEESGDYINASYVNILIPGSEVTNRYIAAQGPLPTTCTAFWQMCWEQETTLVVMLTANIEKGRSKCHQYWPDVDETTTFGDFSVTSLHEDTTPSVAIRQLSLQRSDSSDHRIIAHMQYISWPDHGVPSDATEFIDFVERVRASRVDQEHPTVVHCSAGIGRTGVLITMETAMCLMEADQAVVPLEIVREMREQRAMLIQTPSQYHFVCEAIVKVYHEQYKIESTRL